LILRSKHSIHKHTDAKQLGSFCDRFPSSNIPEATILDAIMRQLDLSEKGFLNSSASISSD
jgi:hypothetical protein